MNKLEAAIAVNGPDGNSAWYDGGDGFTWQSTITAATGAQYFPASTITPADTQLSGGIAVTDTLVSTGGASGGYVPCQQLKGAWIVQVALLAAQVTLILGIRIVRSIDKLGAQITAAGGALVSIPLSAPLSTSLVSGQTFVLVNAAGTAQTWTTSAAVPAGSLAIPVNSQTPSATYVAGTPAVYTVGNNIVFGWVGNGTVGTPVFPAGQAVALPAFTANPAVVTPGAAGSYVNLFTYDSIQVEFATSSSTVSVTVGSIQTAIA